MSLNSFLATGLCAGTLLLGASAQVTTADVYFPIAGDSKSLMSEFQASIVSSEGQTTVYALSCTDGPCNPIAGGTGTLTFTAAPDTFIYTASLQGGMDYDLQCTLKGCPSISEVKCVTSKEQDGQKTVEIDYPTFTERMPLSLDEEVPEVTAIDCPTTSAPAKKTGSSDDDDDDDEEEEDEDEGGDESEESDADAEGSQEEDGDGDEGSALANVPFFGLVAGAAAGAAAVLI